MSNKSTFSEVITAISERSDLAKSTAEEFIREWVSVIRKGLETDGSVTIAGFGKFELRWMKERSGVNPQTGEEIVIPGQNKVVFKPYKKLREHVNHSYAQMKSEILDRSHHSGSGNGTSQPGMQTGRKKVEESANPPGVREFKGFRILVEDEDGALVVERPSPINKIE